MIKKIAESFNSVTRRVEGVNKSTLYVEEICKTNPQNVTPQLVIENTQNETCTQLLIRNTQNDTHPSVLYNTSLENSISIMNSFLNKKHLKIKMVIFSGME